MRSGLGVQLVTGFGTVLAVIGCGVVLAHAGVLDARAHRTLAEVSFFVATPALMLITISEIDPGIEVAANVLAAAVSLGATAAVYLGVALMWWRREPGEALIGALASSYVNAGNLGIAVAAYVVGDTVVVVPALLVQLLIVQPLSLAYLDRRAVTGTGTGTAVIVRRLVSNPLTLASVCGLALASAEVRLPQLAEAPVRLLAGLAIPAMLLAYGAALRLSPPIGGAGHRREVVLAVSLKVGLMPIIAYGIGVTCGLEGDALLGVVITAALPTAQNIFLHATRYRVGETLAREVILVTTLCCLPVSFLVVLLLT